MLEKPLLMEMLRRMMRIHEIDSFTPLSTRPKSVF